MRRASSSAPLDFAAFWSQTVGLQHTTPGINAFLTATYCVIVPFLWWIIARKRPTVFNIGAAVLAVVGIWLVSVTSSDSSLSMGYGEAMTLLCALLFGLHMVYVSKFSRKKNDVLVLTVFQFVAEGTLGCVFGAATETPARPVGHHAVHRREHGLLGGVRLRHRVRHPKRRAGLHPLLRVRCFSPLSRFSAWCSRFLLYGEVVTGRLLLGFALIFAAIVISETFPLKRKG